MDVKFRSLFAMLVGICWLGMISIAHANATWHVTLDTVPLMNNAQGPFLLDFQLINGKGINGSNTVILGNFNLVPGATGAGVGVGGASGSLASGIVLTDASFLNEFKQFFIAGASLSFDVSMTTTVEPGVTPDGFTIAILDGHGRSLPTQSLASAFLAADISSGNPSLQTFAALDPYAAIGTPGIVPQSDSQLIAPNVVGQNQADATAILAGVGLIGMVSTQSSTTVPVGVVISENPVAGTSVSPGSTVNLLVSSGPVTVAVPKVVGDTLVAATAAITGGGLTVGQVSYGSSDTVPAGIVEAQFPLAGFFAVLGTPVSLEVSTGPLFFTIPAVVGQTQAAADNAIIGVVDAQFVLGTVTLQPSSTVPPGTVLSQNPPGGSSAAPYSTVYLVVSSGPAGQAQPFAYVLGYDDTPGITSPDRVSVINTVTNTVVGDPIPLPVNGRGGVIAVNPEGTLAYVATDLALPTSITSVTAIDTATNTVIVDISGVGVAPTKGVAFDATGRFAYVLANSLVGGPFIGSTYEVIDTTTNTVSQGIQLPEIGSLYIVLNPVGNFAYVLGYLPHSYGPGIEDEIAAVDVINTKTRTLTATISIIDSLPGYDNSLAVNPAGTFVYVGHRSINHLVDGIYDVAVIDTATNTVVADIPAGRIVRAMAVNPAGTFVYVLNEGAAGPGCLCISIINTATNQVDATIELPQDSSLPEDIAFDATGRFAYVTTVAQVWVIDTATNTVLTGPGFPIPVWGNCGPLTCPFQGTRIAAGAPPASIKLAVSSINGGANPTATVAFNVVVQAQDSLGMPHDVLADTGVTLSLAAGTGVLGGTLNCTIPAGSHSCTVIGVTYSKGESGVIITATRIRGDMLAAVNSAPFTVNRSILPGPTTVAGNITGKTGPQNARIWTVTLYSSGPGAALDAQIIGLSLTQTFGPACTPVVRSAFPVAVGDILAGGSLSTQVTIDFTGCAASTRFRVDATFMANGGQAVIEPMVRYNQYE